MVTLGVTDISVLETSPSGSLLSFLGLTTPSDMVNFLSLWIRRCTHSSDQGNHTQAMLKLRVTSFVVANTTAKESRIKVTLYGATFSLHPDLQWINDSIVVP